MYMFTDPIYSIRLIGKYGILSIDTRYRPHHSFISYLLRITHTILTAWILYPYFPQISYGGIVHKNLPIAAIPLLLFPVLTICYITEITFHRHLIQFQTILHKSCYLPYSNTSERRYKIISEFLRILMLKGNGHMKSRDFFPALHLSCFFSRKPFK